MTINNQTFADVFRPLNKTYRLIYDIALIFCGSIFIALSSRIAIRLPFSPVPITGQTLAVLLTGIILGSKRGFLSLLTYIFEGSVGLPVFAGGASGIIYLFGPTGGYIFGFAVAALTIGILSEKGWDRKIITTFLLMLIGNGIIYIFGLSYLSKFVGYNNILSMGLYPFLIGDVFKIILAMTLLPFGWKLVGKRDRILN
ncbi:MAG TPA: biotin transporter BioY [candidate division WOR-3 bacterium]|uniref:Biotin transporter n=1 Tax=candidate division WOR-3 bacterium TaxID=2052148 RepID=A0A7C5DD23_UNCW3|nr:biotin transporter BioY [candidate division WOR-3 bacterium]